MKSIYISQGEEAVSADPDVVVSTILGSCVSICLWDPVIKVGAINHMLLPEIDDSGNPAMSTGAIAMERLVNEMVHHGAIRKNLRAKVFGGANMLAGRTDIGQRNVAFARDYLARESIPCDAESVGGATARRLMYWPATGTVKQKTVEKTEVKEVEPKPIETNPVELF